MSGRGVVLVLLAALVLALGTAAFLGLSRSGSPPPSVASIRPIDPASLPERESPGATLLATRCTGCHAVPDPSMHSAAEWGPVIRRMGSHMQVRMLAPLTQAEAEELLSYLSRHGRAP